MAQPTPMRMRAAVIEAANTQPRLIERPIPEPGPGQVLIKMSACGVCRTDLHVIDGELLQTRYPIVPGHQIVGTVAALGPGVSGKNIGDRVGVTWLGRSCGQCQACARGEENLCEQPVFTGCTRDGGFAEYAVADAEFC